MLRATTACTFSTSQLPKVVRAWCVLYILTSKCAPRHNGVHFLTSQLPKVVREWCVLYILTSKCASCHNSVHFFNISTSKSGPSMVCFVHFDFDMCFAPQRRALFRHRNVQKWSEPLVFHFDFDMCFAPQRRALFRHLNFQKWSDNGVFCTF